MNRPFRRPAKPSRAKRRVMHAYDAETQPVAAGGVPAPLALTVTTEGVGEYYVTRDWDTFRAVWTDSYLVEENVGHRFVAQNGNNFDAYLVIKALSTDSRYLIEPWLTRSKQLRGFRVSLRDDPKTYWIFSDAKAMTGQRPDETLSDFLAAFAPEHHKQKIDVLHFDPYDPRHRAYNIEDAEGLDAALHNAETIFEEITGLPLQNTIGKQAIMTFQRNMPEDVLVWPPPRSMRGALDVAKRGGFVFCKGRYRGKIWKYDINQSYAHQMRKPLPSGRALHVYGSDRTLEGYCGLWRATISRKSRPYVPFYCRSVDRSFVGQSYGENPVETWITDAELAYLRKHRWTVEAHEGWIWTDSFSMVDYVDQLQAARQAAGPKTPKGLSIKSIGNNSFGKSLEETDGIRLVVSAVKPGDEYIEFQAEDPDYDGWWMTIASETECEPDYRRPQLGIFIMAYGRLQVMEQALQDARHVIYIDTDCVVFATDQGGKIDIDPARYGAWKVEEEGEEYLFINKKAYSSTRRDGSRPDYPDVAHAKGLHVADITADEWEHWYATGEPPIQTQVQRQGLLRVIGGDIMYVERKRTGCFALEFVAD